MRIVAGKYGGRKLVAPKGRGVRPTLEKVREAIFDTLGPRLEGAVVLDLFAGSGAMGFEALSRGAARVVFVEAEPRPIDAIRENAASFGVDRDSMNILFMTALNAIRRLSAGPERFDVVFVDPPYESGLYEETMLELQMSGIVVSGGTVAVEHARRFNVDPVYGPLLMKKDRRYGDTCVAYYINTSQVRSDESKSDAPEES